MGRDNSNRVINLQAGFGSIRGVEGAWSIASGDLYAKGARRGSKIDHNVRETRVRLDRIERLLIQRAELQLRRKISINLVRYIAGRNA